MENYHAAVHMKHPVSPISLHGRVPVQAPERFLDNNKAGYLAVRLFNAEGSGFNLSPDGGT